MPTHKGFESNFRTFQKLQKSTGFYSSSPKSCIRLHPWIFQSRYPIIPCLESNHRGDPYHRFEMHILHLSRANHCVVILSWRGSGEIADLAKIQSGPRSALQPREIRDVTPITTNRISMKNERKFSLDVADPQAGVLLRILKSAQILQNPGKWCSQDQFWTLFGFGGFHFSGRCTSWWA